MIRAEVHSDDRCIEVEFDATEWFKKAKGRDILRLAQCGWGGDYPADEVAIRQAEKNGEIAHMFRYLEDISDDPAKKDQSGFECHVNPDDAMTWIRKHKAGLVAIVEAINEDPASFDSRTLTFIEPAKST
jgi:hypothetical protein